MDKYEVIYFLNGGLVYRTGLRDTYPGSFARGDGVDLRQVNKGSHFIDFVGHETSFMQAGPGIPPAMVSRTLVMMSDNKPFDHPVPWPLTDSE